MVGQAFGGLVSTLSDRDDARLTGTCLADLITGLSTATGILAALVGRGTTGTGSRLETSITEAVSTLTADAVTQLFANGTPPTRQSRHPQGQNFCLKTATDDFIVLHLSSSQKFWESIVATINRPDLLHDARFTTFPDREAHYFELAKILEAEFRLRPATDWEKLLIDHDVPFAPVLSVEGYRAHPQVQALEIFEPEHDGLALLRPPWRFDGQRPDRTGHAPRVGEHTRQIADEIYDPTHTQTLIDTGVLYPAPTH
jgi:crotonobetainyl-CoA:carnitine CoA-transferase CaiB-like acyl-CoA transferase